MTDPQTPPTTKTKYVVVRTNIADDDGNKVKEGSVVELSRELAKHYNKLGFLAPYIPEGEDENDETPDNSAERIGARQTVRSIRQTGANSQPARTTDATEK